MKKHLTNFIEALDVMVHLMAWPLFIVAILNVLPSLANKDNWK
jgi:hypothetical protein